MIFRIHFIWPDGTPDHILVKADTIDEIRVIVKKEMKSRNATYSHSEEL